MRAQTGVSPSDVVVAAYVFLDRGVDRGRCSAATRVLTAALALTFGLVLAGCGGRLSQAGAAPADATPADATPADATPADATPADATPADRPASRPDRPLTLAALGDSYSSGEGTPPFEAMSAGCRRSSGAWPRLLAELDPPVTLTLHAACSGATTAALHDSQKNADPQLISLRELTPPPDVVTVTIGGNDAGFSRVVLSCVIWKCFWNGDDQRRRMFVREELPDILVASYSAVREAAPNSRVVVVGYPHIFPRSQRDNTCDWLSSEERRQLTSLNNTLNRVIRRAADDADVEFVSTARALRGHEMCTDDPWVNPVGLLGPERDLSAHPTEHGQRAIAEAVHEHLVDEDR